MREINVAQVEKAVEELFIKANYILSDDMKEKIEEAISREDNPAAQNILQIIRDNYKKAEEMVYPMCQDTGMAVVFLEIGQDIHFTGGLLREAIDRGVAGAYEKGYLRKSIVADPLRRTNTKNNLPPVVHTEIVEGDRLKIYALPKGFGSENQSQLKMLVPSDGREGIIDFIVNGVVQSGGKGCPPCVIGVGIGGNFETCAYQAKKALLRSLNEKHNDPFYREMEEEIYTRINESHVGSMGLGGKVTCLGVNIIASATHIAGMPVAYNYCCHASRHQSVEI